MNFNAIVTAAGDNENSASKPYFMRKALFKPIIEYTLDALRDAGCDEICVLTDERAEELKNMLGEKASVVESADDVFSYIKANNNVQTVFMGAYTPLIPSETIKSALEYHREKKNDVTMLTVPLGSDDAQGSLIAAFCFETDAFLSAAEKCENENPSVSDVCAVIKDSKGSCGFFDAGETPVVSDARSLNDVSEEARHRVLDALVDKGAEIPCRDSVVIAPDCLVGEGTLILPGTVIKENSKIGSYCVIGPNSYVENAEIGDGVKFNNGQIRSAKILDNADIGPFVQIRPNSVVGDSVHLGNFVEVKNSTIDTGTKVSHLTYVGDSDVGKSVNFGCGVVTVNYNGKDKNRTTIRDGAFIGCNTNLIAPVTVGENSYTAAGSTITDDVPDNSLGIARERQTNKEDWVKEKQPYKKKV